MHRLRGAVSMEEQRNRLGDYYTVTWKASAVQPTRVVMHYQQAATGAKILQMSRDLPNGLAGGKIEFAVTGDSYNKRGRVLTWRIRLMAGKQVLAEKRSYLWR